MSSPLHHGNLAERLRGWIVTVELGRPDQAHDCHSSLPYTIDDLLS
ncbi:UNVERIFIED_ORG: hypothetical protein LHJ69_05395 [Shinella sp. XGS7]|nr:hypothetical protein [Shinella sp. XGS7]